MQDNIGELLNEVAAVPLLQANTISAQFVIVAGNTALTKDLAHGLARPWAGWALADVDQLATIYRPSDANPSKFLTLAVKLPAALVADLTVSIKVLVW